AETAAIRANDASEDIAGAVLDCVARTVGKVIENAKERYGISRVIVVGGVGANKQVRQYVGNSAVFASTKLSSDNAVGIALLGGIE
ncbi:MAG: O-sialoglycoprotein endopeptidase, partial [Clostridiaceae bacterium]|nr:O-sialoglycoprotein endopeptidase [Clostridiaceae bacterium]